MNRDVPRREREREVEDPRDEEDGDRTEHHDEPARDGDPDRLGRHDDVVPCPDAAKPHSGAAPRGVRARRRRDGHRLGCDAGDGGPHAAHARGAAARLAGGRSRPDDGMCDRSRLPRALARAAASPRMAARDPRRRRVGRGPSREGIWTSRRRRSRSPCSSLSSVGANRFDVPGDPASVRLGLGLGAALAGDRRLRPRRRDPGARPPESRRRRAHGSRHRARLRSAVLLAAPVRAGGRAERGGAARRADARRDVRHRQPVVLRASSRQELPLLADPARHSSRTASSPARRS